MKNMTNQAIPAKPKKPTDVCQKNNTFRQTENNDARFLTMETTS
jgi:hypothetical protein